MSGYSSNKLHKSFGFKDFLWRLLAAMILVLTTFNPSGYSYVHWAKGAFVGEGLEAVHFFVSVILLVGWTIFVIATRRSLGTLGTVLGVALLGTGIWLLVDLGMVNVGSARTVTWLGLLTLATLLAIGLSWSHVWRRLTGQLEVDEVED